MDDGMTGWWWLCLALVGLCTMFVWAVCSFVESARVVTHILVLIVEQGAAAVGSCSHPLASQISCWIRRFAEGMPSGRSTCEEVSFE